MVSEFVSISICISNSLFLSNTIIIFQDQYCKFWQFELVCLVWLALSHRLLIIVYRKIIFEVLINYKTYHTLSRGVFIKSSFKATLWTCKIHNFLPGFGGLLWILKTLFCNVGGEDLFCNRPVAETSASKSKSLRVSTFFQCTLYSEVLCLLSIQTQPHSYSLNKLQE